MSEGNTPTGSAGTAGATPQPRDPHSGQFRSMSEAVTALESLLPPDEGQEGSDEANEEQDAEAGADEAQADEEGSETEGTEDEAAEADDEEPGSDDEEQEEQPARGRQFTVRIDGKDMRVDESELIAGYSRQSDYTRKTQALANDRKGFEQEQAQTRQERTEYAALLPKLRQALATGMGQEPNWAQLQTDDAKNGTTKFPYEWARWQQHLARQGQIQAEEQRVSQRQAQEAQAREAQIRAAEQEALHRALPQWKDPKVAKRETQLIANMMRSLGFADDDIAIHDHKALLIARKAALYDQLQAKRPELRQRMQQAPVLRPGGGEPRQRGAKDQAAKRLNQSGSVKDAASLLEHFL